MITFEYRYTHRVDKICCQKFPLLLLCLSLPLCRFSTVRFVEIGKKNWLQFDENLALHQLDLLGIWSNFSDSKDALMSLVRGRSPSKPSG